MTTNKPKPIKVAKTFKTDVVREENFSMYDKNSLSRRERLIDWITLYRRNLELFVQHYLKLKLHPYQKIFLHLMGVNDKFMWVASRATGKSFLTALYCVCRCILYPNTQMVIVAKKSGQAALIITEKIGKELMTLCPVLHKEIVSIREKQGAQECIFSNGSYIKVVVLNDSARGERSNCIIFEEYRLLDKQLIESVIIPFNISRTPPYTQLEKYKNLPQEQSQQIFISSAWWKTNFMWQQIVDMASNMVNGQKCIIAANDLYLAIDSKIKTKADIFGERATMDAYTYAMEYENQMIGEGSDSYYTLKDFEGLRQIKTAYYPLRQDDIIKFGHKNNTKIPTKAPNEIRVLAIDIAMKAGKENDNTIFHVICGTLEDYGYQRNFVYTEGYNGKATSLQALRIKQLFYEFDIDYIVLDTLNAGISVYDELTKETVDSDTGERYAPMTVIKDNDLLLINDVTLLDLQQRTLNKNSALPVIFPMQANLQLNSLMSIDLKKQLEQKKIWLCADEQNQMDLLMQTNKTFREGDKFDREFYLRPFIEHSELIKECVNLSMSLNNGYIKLQEPKDGRKDRFSAANYGSYFFSLLERKNIKQNNSYGLEAFQEAFGKNRTRVVLREKPKGFKFL